MLLPNQPSPWGFAAELLDPEPDPYWDDPYGWVRRHIEFRPDEPGPSIYQADIMGQLPHRRRVAVRSLHGAGKTTTAAWIVLWFADTRERAGKDWKVITTASVWRQLEHYLWPEIRKWARRCKDVRFDPERHLYQLKLQPYFGSAFAVASDQPTSIEGAHADEILYVLDEAKAIPSGTWDAVEGAFSTGNAYALAISTPGPPQGRFYEIHTKKPGYQDWWTRAVGLAEAVAAGRVNPEWAQARARQWGEKSAVYQNRVEGNFAASDEDAVVPLAWLEAANERWIQSAGMPGGIPLYHMGLDVARGGGDKSVIAKRHGPWVDDLERYDYGELNSLEGRCVQLLNANPGAIIDIDVVGMGAGVFDHLHERFGGRVRGFNASSGTQMRDFSGELPFLNKRAAAWWNLRDVLNPTYDLPVALPPDDQLIGDLTAPKWWTTSGGRIQVEPKAEIAKRIGRSTDDGDATVQAFWPGEPTAAIYVEPERDTAVSISPM